MTARGSRRYLRYTDCRTDRFREVNVDVRQDLVYHAVANLCSLYLPDFETQRRGEVLLLHGGEAAEEEGCLAEEVPERCRTFVGLDTSHRLRDVYVARPGVLNSGRVSTG